MTDLYDPHIITETDTPTGLKEAIEQVEAAEIEEALDWEHWLEVRECCGGTDWSCVHFRSYPPKLERDEY